MSFSSQTSSASFGHFARWSLRGLLVVGALQVAACGPDRLATGSIVPNDNRERHPIVLGERQITADILLNGGRVDPSTINRIHDFANGYAERGRGPIAILVPRGGSLDVQGSVESIRRELARGGARTAVQLGSYQVQDPLQAAPIRMSYLAIQARVATRCGEWPADLASGSTIETWENRPYWNHGCSTQSKLAAMVADPRDLAGPRGETPADVAMRIRAIKNVRAGSDPGTGWRTQNTNIGQAGGN